MITAANHLHASRRHEEDDWQVGYRFPRQRTVKVVHSMMTWQEARDTADEMAQGWPDGAGVEIYYLHETASSVMRDWDGKTFPVTR